MRPPPPRFPVLRPPPPRLVAALVLATFAALFVHRTTSTAATRTAELGAMVDVAVVRHDRSAGAVLEGGDVALERRPVAHLPDGAVREDVTGRTLRADVRAGEVLVVDRVSGEGQRGPAALVPDGWRAVAVPVFEATVPARPGDLVDVIASFDPSIVARDPTLVVASDAVVVAVADDAVTVAVPRSRATEVAFALANGIVSLALVG